MHDYILSSFPFLLLFSFLFSSFSLVSFSFLIFIIFLLPLMLLLFVPLFYSNSTYPLILFQPYVFVQNCYLIFFILFGLPLLHLTPPFYLPLSLKLNCATLYHTFPGFHFNSFINRYYFFLSIMFVIFISPLIFFAFKFYECSRLCAYKN